MIGKLGVKKGARRSWELWRRVARPMLFFKLRKLTSGQLSCIKTKDQYKKLWSFTKLFFKSNPPMGRFS
jgi:hypothetical protein